MAEISWVASFLMSSQIVMRIDTLVYKLYSLTEEEIKIVEES